MSTIFITGSSSGVGCMTFPTVLASRNVDMKLSLNRFKSVAFVIGAALASL
jgi:hypothetical protein